jgi:phage terminase small subunit
MKKLTAKQARFVLEFMVDLNGAAAARRAGYSARTAKEIGSENLTKPNIAAAIAAEQQRIKDSLQWDAQWVRDRMQELAIECLATNQTGVAAGLLNTMARCEGMLSDGLKIDGKSSISFHIKTGKK